MNYTLNNIQSWFCYKVIPLVYDNSLSYYEVLCKLTDYINNVIADERALATLVAELNTDVITLKSEVAILNTEMEKVKNGDYVSLYLDSIIAWINNNLQELVAGIVKYVFFQIDDTGYFNAVIPDSWDFITFDTDYEPNSATYLHLILNY